MSRDGAGKRSGSGVTRLVAAMLVCAGVLAGCSDSPEEMVSAAQAYLAKGEWSAASIELKNALQQDGNIALARFLLGTIELDQGNVASGVKNLERALELGHPSAAVAPHLARGLVMSGRFDKVIDDYAGTRIDDPAGQVKLLGAVGDARFARGELPDSRTAYESALSLAPDDLTAILGLGRIRLLSGDLDAALADADRAVAINGAFGDAHALRADALNALGRTDDAVSALEAAVKASPRSRGYHFALISLLLRGDKLDAAEGHLAELKKFAAKEPATHYLSAFVDFRRDRVPAAREAIDAMMRAVPEHTAGQLLAGAIYLRQGEQAQAQRFLQSVLSKMPENALARRLLAASLLQSGDAERAREQLKPLMNDAGDVGTMMLAGQINLASGDFAGASGFFERVVAAKPGDAAARTRLAVARLSSGDTQRGIADLEAAAELDDGNGQPEFTLALAYLRSGDYDKALEAQQDLEKKFPTNPQTFNLKGGILLAKRDAAGARAAFERAVELDPKSLSPVVNLVRIELAENKPQDAVARLERLVAASPSNPEPSILLAELQRATGAPVEAVRSTLANALKANPQSVPARVAMARLHLMMREHADALRIAQALSSAQPDDAAIATLLGQAQFAAGDQRQALVSFEKAARLEPRSPQALITLADAYRAANDIVASVQNLKRALSLQPDLIQAQVRLHGLHLQQRSHAEALKIAKAVQQQRPDAGVGFMMEGDVLLAQEQWEPALKVLQSGFAKDPSGDLIVRIHAAAARIGKLKEIEKPLVEWMRANPGDFVSRNYMAERAIAENRLEEAEASYRELLASNGNNALMLNNLAWVAGQLGRDDAVALAERAVLLEPGNGAFLDTLGMLQVKKGDHEKGIASLKRAVELAPRVPALRLNLARAYLDSGRKTDAARTLDEIVKDNPTNEPLLAEVDKLRKGL